MGQTVQVTGISANDLLLPHDAHGFENDDSKAEAAIGPELSCPSH